MIEIIPPATKLNGSVKLPGSKSITNRALLLAALADGESQISGALKSDDTKFMAAALRKLGIRIDEPDDTTFVVLGRSGKLAESAEPLFLGNAGTAVRFLTAAAILVNGETIIDGDPRMRERPIGDLVDALRQLGAKIEYLGKEGCPPLRIISDGKIESGKVKIRADISSQFVSAVLMILPLTKNDSLKLELLTDPTSQGYIQLTLHVMKHFGVELEPKDSIFPHKNYEAQKKYEVEADASSATYFWAAEELLKQEIIILNPNNNPDGYIQPDTAAFEIIRKFPNLPRKIDGIGFPDAIPTLAVLAAFSNSDVRFSGIANLRVKECDRITALAKNLNKIKEGLAEESGDNLIIHGDLNLAQTGKPAEIETYNDHRIAMAFFLAGLKIPGIKIRNPDCVAKSFPNFFEVWENLGVKIKK